MRQEGRGSTSPNSLASGQFLDCLPGVTQSHAVRTERGGRRGMLLAEQTQQQVLCTNVIVLESVGLFRGELEQYLLYAREAGTWRITRLQHPTLPVGVFVAPSGGVWVITVGGGLLFKPP